MRIQVNYFKNNFLRVIFPYMLIKNSLEVIELKFQKDFLVILSWEKILF
jgi:hypothetical protein